MRCQVECGDAERRAAVTDAGAGEVRWRRVVSGWERSWWDAVSAKAANAPGVGAWRAVGVEGPVLTRGLP